MFNTRITLSPGHEDHSSSSWDIAHDEKLKHLMPEFGYEARVGQCSSHVCRERLITIEHLGFQLTLHENWPEVLEKRGVLKTFWFAFELLTAEQLEKHITSCINEAVRIARRNAQAEMQTALRTIIGI